LGHKFSLGQAVTFTPGAGEVLSVATKAIIQRLLPKESADYQYHVQVDPDGPRGGLGKTSFNWSMIPASLDVRLRDY
jgi:hypothetical protein